MQSASSSSVDFMKRAIVLGEMSRLVSPPNPWVGALIVKNQQIIAEGSTRPPGQEHAEIVALKKAAELADGSDLYVTLEPCSHYGRTPPCYEAVIKAGIKRVFVSVQDPDPRVSGRGIQALRDAGVSVTVGLCEAETNESLKPYLHHRRTTTPYTIIKAAVSLDGRIAAQDGTSQWISSEEARVDAHELRACCQAIMVGSNTALKDRPALTVRLAAQSPIYTPIRVLVDGRGRVPAEGPLFDTQLAPTLVFSSKQASSSRISEWEKAGAEVLVLELDATGKVDLREGWVELGKRGVLQLLVEGGPVLQSTLIADSNFQQLTLYSGPLLLGATGQPLFLPSIATLSQAPCFQLKKVTLFGQSVRTDYSPF